MVSSSLYRSSCCDADRGTGSANATTGAEKQSDQSFLNDTNERLLREVSMLREELRAERSKRLWEIAKEKAVVDGYTLRRWCVKKYNRLLKLLYLLRHHLVDRHVTDYWKYEKHRPQILRLECFPRCMIPENQLPSLAIVTPSFNQGHFIEQTIRSVLESGHPSLSYAVVDGGSKDNTTTIIDQYRHQFAYAVSESDDGQTDAIVKGFNHVSGNIMAYLNADDVLMPGALKFVGEYFAMHPEVDVIYGHRVIIDENSQEIGRWVVPNHSNHTTKRFDYIPQETMFWRESIYHKCGGFNPTMRFAMDWDFILRLQNCGARFKRVPYFLGCFRCHPAQKSQTIINSIGEEESKALRIRELGPDESAWQIYKYNVLYTMKAFAYDALIKRNIRF